MITYREFQPTGFDTPGLNLPDQHDWLVSCGRNRDSDCLDESNYHCALKALGGEGEDVEVHRFGHWACGWLEIIIVRPGSSAAVEAERIADRLADYPVLDEYDFAEREQQAANEAWEHCYNDAERIAYVRKHRRDFEFHGFADMLSCVRGKYFAGDCARMAGP